MISGLGKNVFSESPVDAYLVSGVENISIGKKNRRKKFWIELQIFRSDKNLHKQ